jgi:hypothetical protein
MVYSGDTLTVARTPRTLRKMFNIALGLFEEILFFKLKLVLISFKISDPRTALVLIIILFCFALLTCQMEVGSTSRYFFKTMTILYVY